MTFDMVRPVMPRDPEQSLSEKDETGREYFVDLVRSYGFVEKWDVELLVARYFHGMSLRRIQADYPGMSFKTIHRRVQYLNKQVVERGYKLRRGN